MKRNSGQRDTRRDFSASINFLGSVCGTEPGQKVNNIMPYGKSTGCVVSEKPFASARLYGDFDAYKFFTDDKCENQVWIENELKDHPDCYPLKDKLIGMAYSYSNL